MTGQDPPFERTSLFRPRLHATAARQLFPADLAGEWLDELRDVCDELESGSTAAWLPHDLVALVGRLQRCRPELLSPVILTETLSRAEVLLGTIPDCLEAAWGALKLDAWREEMQRLDAADTLDEGDLRERTDWAVDLLEELDDAELIWAASQQAVTAPHWPQRRHELDGRIRFLIDHQCAIIPAGVFVQSLAAGIRPELDWRRLNDPLAQTVRKYEYLLDYLELVQEEANQARLPGLNAEAMTPRATLLKPQPPDWLPVTFTQRATAAAEEEAGVYLPRLIWVDSKQHLQASLKFPTQLLRDTVLEIEIYPASGASLTGLEPFPAPLLLGGLRGDIERVEDGLAIARFSYREIAAVQRFLQHFVVRKTVWTARFDVAQFSAWPGTAGEPTGGESAE